MKSNIWIEYEKYLQFENKKGGTQLIANDKCLYMYAGNLNNWTSRILWWKVPRIN